MVVDAHCAWNFAYVLPSENHRGDPELAIQDALQMEWSESPAFFCAATETARDLAAKAFTSNNPQQPHPMEATELDIEWTKIPRSQALLS